MVLGQAVNGWEQSFDKYTEIDSGFVNEAFKTSNRQAILDIGLNPIDIVNVLWSNSSYLNQTEAVKECFKAQFTYQYFYSRSLFWNVIYKSMCMVDFGGDLNNCGWSKKMVWSNLYKIAPDGKNPNLDEQIWQREQAIKLIKLELDLLRPKFCLVLTNDSWWKPFRDELKTEQLKTLFESEFIESLESYNQGQTKIIVTKRPFIGNTNKMSDEIRKIIEECQGENR